MIEVTGQGKVIDKTGGNRLGRLPEAASGDLLAGPKHNFQVFDPLDFLAEVTQHIPDPGDHLIRYYDFYSNKSGGMRTQGQAQPASPAAPNSASATVTAAFDNTVFRLGGFQAKAPSVL